MSKIFEAMEYARQAARRKAEAADDGAAVVSPPAQAAQPRSPESPAPPLHLDADAPDHGPGPAALIEQTATGRREAESAPAADTATPPAATASLPIAEPLADDGARLQRAAKSAETGLPFTDPDEDLLLLGQHLAPWLAVTMRAPLVKAEAVGPDCDPAPGPVQTVKAAESLPVPAVVPPWPPRSSLDGAAPDASAAPASVDEVDEQMALLEQRLAAWPGVSAPPPMPDEGPPTPDGAAPMPDGAAPMPDGAAPTDDGVSPVPDGAATRNGGVSTVRDGGLPMGVGAWPTGVGLLPMADGTAALKDGVPPGNDEASTMAAPPPSLAVVGPPALDDDAPQLDTEAEIARLRERLMRAPERSRWFGDVVKSITPAGADIDWHRRAQIRWLVVEVVLLGGLAVAAVLILVLF